MKTHFDRTKTLQELENNDWGEPADGDTSLIERCHRLRRVPVQNLAADDLRLLIGQQIGLFFLVPVALDRLESNPLIDCGLYPGDLLAYLLNVPEPYWDRHTDKREAMRKIIAKAQGLIETREDDELRLIRSALASANAFCN